MPSFSKNLQLAMAPYIERYYGGGEILFVGNRTGMLAGDGSTPGYPLSSPLSAISKLQGTTKRGHLLFLLPGSAWNVDAADWASATGTADSFAVCALGHGAMRASLTWTTATSTWLLDTDSIAIDNCRLFLAGAHAAGSALTVAAPITVSGAGCSIRRCKIFAGFDADQIVTIGITTTAAADDFTFGGENENDGNYVHADSAAVGTTFMQLVGADRVLVGNNYISYPTSSAAVGPVHLATTASTQVRITRNFIHNSATGATGCISGVANATGEVSYNLLRNETNTSLAHIVNNSALWSQFENYGVNDNGERGAILGTVSA
jgi:hypothetical protein